MKTSEVIERLEEMQAMKQWSRGYRDALAIAIEILKRMEAGLPKTQEERARLVEKIAGTPLKGSGA